MSSTHTPQSAFVRELTAQLRTRLGELDNETRILRQALAILARPPIPPKTNARGPRVSAHESLRRRLLDAIAESPGMRASVLALSERHDAQEVKRVLEELRAMGLVEQDGMGWRRADSATVTT